MSDSEHIYSNQMSVAFDDSSDPLMNETLSLPTRVNDIVSTMQEDGASSDQLRPLIPWEHMFMEGVDMLSGMSQDLLLNTQMADMNENELSMTHNASQSNRIRSPSYSANTRVLLETDDVSSDATDRLAHTIGRLSAKISDIEELSRPLESKVDEFSSRLDRTDSQLDDLNNKMDGLGDKFKMLDGLLLEVIRREHMAMQELGALASRYHGTDS